MRNRIWMLGAVCLLGAVVTQAYADTTVLIPNRPGYTNAPAQQQAPRPATSATTAPQNVPYPQQQAPAAQQQNPVQQGQDEEAWFSCKSTAECGAIPGPCNAPMAVNTAYMEQFKRSMASEDMSKVSCPKMGAAEMQIMATFVPMCVEGHCAVGPRQ